MSQKIILDEHIGTPPPSTVDIDRIIRRERRGRLLRRISLGGGAAAVTVLALAVGVALAGGTRPPSGPLDAAASASPQASVSPSPVPSPSPSGGVKVTHVTATQLQIAIEEAFAGVAPDAKWIYMPDVPGEPPLADGHPVVREETRETVGFAARSGVSRKGAKAGLYLWLRPEGCFSQGGGPSMCSPALSCPNAAANADCTSSTTPNGLPLLEMTETSAADGNKKYRFYLVQIGLPNGYRLTLNAVNYFGGDGSPVSSETPLLSKTELKAMALAITDRISS